MQISHRDTKMKDTVMLSSSSPVSQSLVGEKESSSGFTPYLDNNCCPVLGERRGWAGKPRKGWPVMTELGQNADPQPERGREECGREGGKGGTSTYYDGERTELHKPLARCQLDGIKVLLFGLHSKMSTWKLGRERAGRVRQMSSRSGVGSLDYFWGPETPVPVWDTSKDKT